MTKARRWVRQNGGAGSTNADAAWRSLERYAGRGPLGVGRTQALLAYIDRQLSEHNGARPMRRLRHVAADYLEVIDERMRASWQARQTIPAREPE